MRRHLIALLLLMLPQLSHAQRQGQDAPDTTRIRNLVKRNTRIFEGMTFGAFTATRPDGRILSNRDLAGKVSLILFWYPTISYSDMQYVANYLQLGKIAELPRAHPDFQILSLLRDTVGLAQFKLDNPDIALYTVGLLGAEVSVSDLNGGMGMPSCVLVDRNGKVVRLEMLGMLPDTDGMYDKIKELMLP